MNQTYIKRSLEPVLKKAASEFPAVVLTEPRQSGMTTLFQRLFGKSCRYRSGYRGGGRRKAGAHRGKAIGHPAPGHGFRSEDFPG